MSPLESSRAKKGATRDLSRLLRPRSIAVVGGGYWCQQVVRQSRAMGFTGDIWRVHPRSDVVEGITAVARVRDLPHVPDAVFLGINRHSTAAAVSELAAMGAGGAVCFASGFAEADAEDPASAGLQADLVAAAGDMPILGPNCYGFVNAVDGALLWPDQHGCARVDRGVAILTQSSNIAINLTMQRRALPIAYTVTCGNMAQTTQADIAMALLDDPRVTALGLHVEGFGDTHLWHALAQKAYDKSVPIIVLKIGVSDQAQQATVSHTASLAGSDAGASAFLRYLGIPRMQDLPTFLETLKLLHCHGVLPGSRLSSISCSGGEASLVADMAAQHAVSFPPLSDAQRNALSSALGPMVALSNPLDYHTYVWGDADKMAAAWLPMAAPHIDLVMIILDYPHTDATAWDCATQAAIVVHKRSGRPVAVVATLPELLPPDVSARLMAAGVTPLHGVREALGAVEAAAGCIAPQDAPPLRAGPSGKTEMLSEAEAKQSLARFGITVPRGLVVKRADLGGMASALVAPLALKAIGLAHKSEAGALKLNMRAETLATAVRDMPGDQFLIEEMVAGSVAELLIGVTRDAAHGFVLTLAAGGVLTELWDDQRSLLVPASRDDVAQVLAELRIYPMLRGYRGAKAACLPAVIDAVMGLQDYVINNAAHVQEVEINPLMCTPDAAIAADALIVRCTPLIPAGEPNGPD
ncbi:acetate--CoA ligase family protein [Roseobacter sp. OBYS 0001]|uniref:acetate--CoA ligase family protein n=1 Tax=Roseobacter sp. OBYS 0001 TaxID=882651 RepID=UPI001BBC4A3A|nr:acetate--CoA ligase family protein [Roseobacter sp. OBYS 0001]GIT87406.1 acyl-CoA synthetase [Roseobacter sp. OBYS 0001]